MSVDTLETLARLILRHGEDRARDCITTTLDLADAQGADHVRAMLDNALHGGQIPEPATQAPGRGRPSNPDSGLIAVWASVEAAREVHGLSIEAACKWLCRSKGTRRNPIQTGIGLYTDHRQYRWEDPETLRGLHKKANKRRETDPDFRAVCDLCLPEIRTRLSG